MRRVRLRIGWPRGAVLVAAAIAALAVGGCRSAPLDDPGGLASGGGASALTVGVPEAQDSAWVPVRASYERVGLDASAWVATAEGKDAGGGGGDLARAAQNPIASLISVPFQNNTNFGIGPEERTGNVLNFQPVVPLSVGTWSLVNRMIIPVLRQPDPTSAHRTWSGLGDINLTTFVVPPAFGKVMVGAGPVFLFPTASNSRLGAQQWGLGPSAVVVATLDKWVLGLLVNNVWSLEGGADELNTFLAQYFVNYNLPRGWYLTSAPIITANWNAPSDDRWVVPFGGGIGKLLKIGPQPANVGVQAYYNVVTPDNGPEWTLRLQAQLLFPK